MENINLTAETVYKILRHTDHTCLSPDAAYEDIDRLCCQAAEYRAASVCVNPSYVEYVRKNYPRENYPNMNICTVIGFPLGANITAIKAYEINQALKHGADEFDMVINIADAKNRLYDKILREIDILKSECRGKILKVIVEACLFDDSELIKLCEVVSDSAADYIKTSTGFSLRGANLRDIKIFSRYMKYEKKIKVSGGIKTLADAEMFLSMGAERLGSSKIAGLADEYFDKTKNEKG